MTPSSEIEQALKRAQDLVQRASNVYAKTRRDLALASGADPETHVQYRSGRRRPDPRALIDMADALGLQIDKLRTLEIECRGLAAEFEATGILRARKKEAAAIPGPVVTGAADTAPPHHPPIHVPSTSEKDKGGQGCSPLELLYQGVELAHEQSDAPDYRKGLELFYSSAAAAWKAARETSEREQNKQVFTAAIDLIKLALRVADTGGLLADPRFSGCFGGDAEPALKCLYAKDAGYVTAGGQATFELIQVLSRVHDH